MRDFLLTVHTFSDFDFSLPQMAALFALDEAGELTVKQVAELLGRSVSATSRLLDQLVERGLVGRREDEHDRRAKRITITEGGRALIAQLERTRAETQWAVVEHLSAEEQAEVARAMALLAKASEIRKDAYAAAPTPDKQTAAPEH